MIQSLCFERGIEEYQDLIKWAATITTKCLVVSTGSSRSARRSHRRTWRRRFSGTRIWVPMSHTWRPTSCLSSLSSIKRRKIVLFLMPKGSRNISSSGAITPPGAPALPSTTSFIFSSRRILMALLNLRSFLHLFNVF